MFKGISQSDRDIRWHRKHLTKLKRRAGIRKAHLAFMNFGGHAKLPELESTLRLSWLQRLLRRIGEFFRKPNYATQLSPNVVKYFRQQHKLDGPLS